MEESICLDNKNGHMISGTLRQLEHGVLEDIGSGVSWISDENSVVTHLSHLFLSESTCSLHFSYSFFNSAPLNHPTKFSSHQLLVN